MDAEQITQTLKNKLMMGPPLGARYRFEIKDVGSVYVDARAHPPQIVPGGEGEAETTLSSSLDTFMGLMNGTVDPNIAFMMGKLKVKGSMGYAMKLNSILED